MNDWRFDEAVFQFLVIFDIPALSFAASIQLCHHLRQLPSSFPHFLFITIVERYVFFIHARSRSECMIVSTVLRLLAITIMR